MKLHMLWLSTVVALQLLTRCRAAPTSSASASGRSSSDGRPSEPSGEAPGEMSNPQSARGRKRPTPQPPVRTHDAEPSQKGNAPKVEAHSFKRMSLGSPSQVPPTPYQTLMVDPTKIFDVRSFGQTHATSSDQHGVGPISQLLAGVSSPSHPPLPPAAWIRALSPKIYANWWLQYRALHNGPLPDIFRAGSNGGALDFDRVGYYQYAKRVLALDELRKKVTSQLWMLLSKEDLGQLNQRLHPWTLTNSIMVAERRYEYISLVEAEKLYIVEVEKILEKVARRALREGFANLF